VDLLNKNTNNQEGLKMATMRQRVMATTLATLFLVVTVAFTFMIIWQVRTEERQQQELNEFMQAQNALEQEEEDGETVLLDNFEPVENIQSLEKIDLEVGQGQEVATGQTVRAHYVGALASTGRVFESSYDRGEPADFSLEQVIVGWQEGVPGMKEGGKRRILIPAAQAYGQNPPPGSAIPPNSDLVFDIELIEVLE
jgi:FKBP-type peptidyl-prolyl cis-trans isomerase